MNGLMHIKALIRYINKSTANKEEIEKRLENCLNAIDESKGSQVTSVSLNGFFSQSQVKIAYDTYAARLLAALEHVENGTKPTTTFRGRIV
jgi:hypothetical protein